MLQYCTYLIFFLHIYCFKIWSKLFLLKTNVFGKKKYFLENIASDKIFISHSWTVNFTDLLSDLIHVKQTIYPVYRNICSSVNCNVSFINILFVEIHWALETFKIKKYSSVDFVKTDAWIPCELVNQTKTIYRHYVYSKNIRVRFFRCLL